MKKNELNRRYRRGLRDIGYSLSRIKTSASYLMGYDFRPDVVFDVGVMNGTPYLYEAFASSKFVMVDPLSESEAVIAGQGLELDYDFVVEAVGSAKGKLKLNIPTTKPGKGADMSSFLDILPRLN